MNTSNATGDRRLRFDRLVAVFYMDMFRFASWLCRDRSIAEEVVQEALLRAWKSLDALRDDVVVAARGLHGIAEVIVTLGGTGALLITEHDAWHARPEPVKVKSTVGAGDGTGLAVDLRCLRRRRKAPVIAWPSSTWTATNPPITRSFSRTANRWAP